MELKITPNVLLVILALVCYIVTHNFQIMSLILLIAGGNVAAGKLTSKEEKK